MPEQQGVESPVRLRQRGIGHGTLFTNAVAYLFYCIMPLWFDIHWHGLRNYHASPSTLITINHKRDCDIIIVAPVLHIKRTAFRDRLRMYFVGRDDLFESGFLTGHLPVNWPWPLGNLIHHFKLAPIMRAFSAYPISSIVNKRFGPLINDVIDIEGDIRLADTVKENYLPTISRQTGDDVSTLQNLTLSEVLGYEYHSLHDLITDTGVLREGLARKVRAYSLRRIDEQLQVFAQILRDGGVCLLSPEGELSPDGRFWPVKSGLYRLLTLAHTGVTVLPVNTTYDFMTRRRMRVHVAVGEEIVVTGPTTKLELEHRVQHAIVSLGRVTMGQIGSEYLLWRLEAGKDTVTEAELDGALGARALVLKHAGLNLDERLTHEKAFHRRLRDFIAYCVGKRMLLRKARGVYLINPYRTEVYLGERRQDPLVYSHNELKSLLEHASR